jgi:hypothetical protein
MGMFNSKYHISIKNIFYEHKELIFHSRLKNDIY